MSFPRIMQAGTGPEWRFRYFFRGYIDISQCDTPCVLAEFIRDLSLPSENR